MTLLLRLLHWLGISIGRKRVESRGTPASTPYEHAVGDIILGGRRRDDPPLPLPPVVGHMARGDRPSVTVETAKRPTAGELMHPVKPKEP